MQIFHVLIFSFTLSFFMAINTNVFFIDAKTNNDTSNSMPDRNSSKLDKSAETDSISVKGLLIVKTIVNNKEVGNKKAADFLVSIHANDPIPASFRGNSNGTNVKLGMGMFSVSQTVLPGYVTSYSSDCFGGIMSVVTKKCTITNVFDYTSSIQ
jgi:hypothetical protein